MGCINDREIFDNFYQRLFLHGDLEKKGGGGLCDLDVILFLIFYMYMYNDG